MGSVQASRADGERLRRGEAGEEFSWGVSLSIDLSLLCSPQRFLSTMPPLNERTPELPPPAKLHPVSPTPDIPRRRIIVLSFWALIILGIPFWWKTTTIERLPLPSAEVEGWVERGVRPGCAAGPPCELTFVALALLPQAAGRG